MKRFTAIVLAAVLLLVSALPIGAADAELEIFHNQSDVADSNVVYGVAETYMVSLPADIVMSTTDATEATVGMSDVKLPRAKTLKVNLSSETYDSGWRLTLEYDADVTLSYSIKNNGTEVENGGLLLAVSGGTPSGETALTLQMTDDPGMSGSYLDTLTFSVSIDEE